MKKPYDPAGHELDELVETLFANAPIGVYIVENRRFRFANSRFAKDLGYLREELLGMDSLGPVVPNDRQMVQESAMQMLKGNRTSPYEFRVLTKSGAMRWVLGGVVPMRYRGRQATLGYYLDVSDQAESRRQREQELAIIYNTVSDVIYMLTVEKDGRYRFVSVNEAFPRTTGISAEQVVGKRVDEIIPEPSLTIVLERYAEAIQEKRTVRWEETSEYPTGRLVGEVSVAPVFDKTGKCTHLVGAVHDITERKRAEDQIRHLNNELEQRIRERTAELQAFTYSVSHDLRAPLRGINGFSQALLEDYQDRLDAQGVDYLKRVRVASQYMGQLIDDLLKLSQVTHAEIRRQNVNLTALARTIAETLRTRQPERQVNFVIADGLVAQGDPVLLELVLQNLLDNAWKFSSRHPSANVEFGTTYKDGTQVYFVRDDGAGFDMAYADKLFGLFQRLHLRTEFEGTGIGLTTVQRIINRHGGRVWAEGAVERGATFHFTLQPERSSP